MRKTDKLKNMELANKKLLGERLQNPEEVDSVKKRIDNIKQEYGVSDKEGSKKIRVIFDGFDTPEQAKAFANWYEGSAEQDTSWLEEHSDLSGAYVDMTRYHEQGGFNVNNNELIIPLTLYYKENEE